MKNYFEKSGMKVIKNLDYCFIGWLILSFIFIIIIQTFILPSDSIDWYFFKELILGFISFNMFPFILYLISGSLLKKHLMKLESKPEDNIIYFRDYLKLPIISISSLYNYNIGENEIAAILFDLETKGYIKLTETSIEISNHNYENLCKVEIQLLNLINKFESYDEFRNKVSEASLTSLYEQGYLKKITKPSRLCIISGIVWIVCTFFNNKFTIDIYLIELLLYLLEKLSLISLVSGIIIWYSKRKALYYRTKKGNEIYSKLIGLENFLKDFSDKEKMNFSGEKIMSEYYLYAILFGFDKDIVSKYMNILKK